MSATREPLLPAYRRETIYWGEPGERTLLLVGDVDRDGVPELVVGARGPRAELYWLDRQADGTWRRHELDADFTSLEAGGVLVDVDGDGDLDLIAGHDARGDRILWWECPDDPTGPWTRREVWQMPARKSHDQLVADLDGDGRQELYFWNQGGGALYGVPLPRDPGVSPWPDVRAVATGASPREEGLAVADVDGDGAPELIAGFSWYKRRAGGGWERHPFAVADPVGGFVTPRVVAADFDGDGRVEIAIAEGDASLARKDVGYGRLVVFHRPGSADDVWEPEVLHERLLDPHSLIAADFDGDGRPDLFCGEMGLPHGNHPDPPALRIYQNRAGRLVEHVIDRGVGVHDARVIELDGRRCIVGKSFQVLRSDAARPREADGIHLWMPEM